MNEFNVIISGGQDFKDYNLLKEKCDFYLSRKIKEGKKIIVISGGTEGADKLGEKYAAEKGYEVRRFIADWNRFGKFAGLRKNQQMTEIGNACIVFLSSYGENKGANNLISTARKNHLLVREINEEA